MNLKTLEHIWIGTKIALLCGFIYFCIMVSRPLHFYFTGYEPRNFSQASSAELDQILLRESRPVFVYFYHKKNSAGSRLFLPILDKFARQLQTKIIFYSHQFEENEIEPFSSYKGFDPLPVIFENGRESKRLELALLPEQEAEGLMFGFFKEYLLAALPERANRSNQDWEVTADNFEVRVLKAKKPVVVDFTANWCPSCARFAPQFKTIGEKYADIADFYYAEQGTSFTTGRRYGIHSIPTIALFYQGKLQKRKNGTYIDLNGNEAQILGMLLPYLNREIKNIADK